MILAKDLIINKCPCHSDGSGLHTIRSGTDLKIVATPPEYEKHMAEALRRGDECVCAQIDGAVVRVPKRMFVSDEGSVEWMLGLC